MGKVTTWHGDSVNDLYDRYINSEWPDTVEVFFYLGKPKPEVFEILKEDLSLNEDNS